MRPPPKQHHNRHPKQQKLDTQIDTPRLGKLIRTIRLQQQNLLQKEQHSDQPVRSVTQQREQNDSEPLGANCLPISEGLDTRD